MAKAEAIHTDIVRRLGQVPRPTTKPENDSLHGNRFTARGSGNQMSVGLRPATIWRGAAFHFLSVFSKKKILWKLRL